VQDIAVAKKAAALACLPYQVVIRGWIAEKAEAVKTASP
jgi:hypothetical protein